MRELYETRTVHSPQSINILYYILYHLTSFSSSYSPREEILCNSPQSVSTVVWKVSCVLSLPLEKVRWKKMEIMELLTTSGSMSFEISHFFYTFSQKMLPAEPATKEALNFLYLSYVRVFIGLAFVFLAGMKEISAGALLSSQENRTLTFLVCQIIFI